MKVAISTAGLGKVFFDGWGNPASFSLDAVSLEIPAGETTGIFGGNGSGKTTLVKLLCGLIRPTAGSVLIFGKPPVRAVAEDAIGFLPERPEFPGYLTVEKTLRFLGRISGLKAARLNHRVRNCMEVVDLQNQAGKRVQTLSKGSLQRLGIAQALVHDPRILILDEPTDGLDPLAHHRVMDVLQNLKAEGKTLLLCSHYLSRMEEFCDKTLILHEGKTLYWGQPSFQPNLQTWLFNYLKGTKAQRHKGTKAQRHKGTKAQRHKGF